MEKDKKPKMTIKSKKKTVKKPKLVKKDFAHDELDNLDILEALRKSQGLLFSPESDREYRDEDVDTMLKRKVTLEEAFKVFNLLGAKFQHSDELMFRETSLIEHVLNKIMKKSGMTDKEIEKAYVEADKEFKKEQEELEKENKKRAEKIKEELLKNVKNNKDKAKVKGKDKK